MSEADKNQISQVLQRYAAGWRNADVPLLKSLWDGEYHGSSYIASERETALFGLESIHRYYDETLAAFPITSMEIENVHISILNGTAHASCDVKISWVWKGSEQFSRPRATFVLRRRGTGWYVLHYHESIQWQLPEA